MDSLKERGKQTSMPEVGTVKFDTCIGGFFFFAPKLVDPKLLLGH